MALTPFYIRRFGRLAPALLLVAVLAGSAFLIEGQRRAAFNSVFAVTYTTNYAAVLSGHHLSGFGHTWSLAVEEHFYLVWPLLMMLLMRRVHAAGFVKAVLVIAAMVLCWRAALFSIFGAQVKLLLYAGTVERLDSLLYGCAAAVAVRQGWRPGTVWMIIGTLMIGATIAWQAPVSTVWNPALVGVGGALLISALDCERRPFIQRMLSTTLLVRAGILSYGIYLWHLPLLQLANKPGEEAPLAIVVAMVLSIVAAELSYRYWEVPIRDRVRRRLAERQPAPIAPT